MQIGAIFIRKGPNYTRSIKPAQHKTHSQTLNETSTEHLHTVISPCRGVLGKWRKQRATLLAVQARRNPQMSFTPCKAVSLYWVKAPAGPPGDDRTASPSSRSHGPVESEINIHCTVIILSHIIINFNRKLLLYYHHFYMITFTNFNYS